MIQRNDPLDCSGVDPLLRDQAEGRLGRAVGRCAAGEFLTVIFPPSGDAALRVRRPITGIGGRFSVEYVVAAALIDRRLGVDTFSDRPVAAPVAALLERVDRRYDETAPRMSNDPATRFSVVEILFADGWRRAKPVATIRGAADIDANFSTRPAALPRSDRCPA
jgi:2-methylcitrate dehydratase PrpD